MIAKGKGKAKEGKVNERGSNVGGERRRGIRLLLVITYLQGAACCQQPLKVRPVTINHHTPGARL